MPFVDSILNNCDIADVNNASTFRDAKCIGRIAR